MADQYLINMMFAEDLLEFLCSDVPLLFGFKIRWRPKFPLLDLENKSEMCDSMFDYEIGWAVYHIINEKVKEIGECYNDFIIDMLQQSKEKDIDDAKFARCALKIAPLFFSKGYSHESFLAYCSMVIGVGYNFLLLEQNCIPERACQVVALVLFTHQMTGQFYEEKGWEGLYDTAYNFIACISDLLEK